MNVWHLQNSRKLLAQSDFHLVFKRIDSIFCQAARFDIPLKNENVISSQSNLPRRKHPGRTRSDHKNTLHSLPLGSPPERRQIIFHALFHYRRRTKPAEPARLPIESIASKLFGWKIRTWSPRGLRIRSHTPLWRFPSEDSASRFSAHCPRSPAPSTHTHTAPVALPAAASAPCFRSQPRELDLDCPVEISLRAAAARQLQVLLKRPSRLSF